MFVGKLNDSLSFGQEDATAAIIMAPTCFCFAVRKALSSPLAPAWVLISSNFSFSAKPQPCALSVGGLLVRDLPAAELQLGRAWVLRP